MKLYIAGSSKELDRAEKWMRRVAAVVGVELTWDWVQMIREKGGGNDFPFLEKHGFAYTDMNAIRDADAFWFLLPCDHMTFGGTWEFGFACGMDHAPARVRGFPNASEPLFFEARSMLTVVSGLRKDAHIFTTLADAHFEADEDAFEYILRHRAV